MWSVEWNWCKCVIIKRLSRHCWRSCTLAPSVATQADSKQEVTPQLLSGWPGKCDKLGNRNTQYNLKDWWALSL